jgi:hypothetical protein
MELDDGTQYLVGWCLDNLRGRVSTEVVATDFVALAFMTESGRAYRLQGPPGRNFPALCAWRSIASARGFDDWEDVSAKIWIQHQLLANPKVAAMALPTDDWSSSISMTYAS